MATADRHPRAPATDRTGRGGRPRFARTGIVVSERVRFEIRRQKARGVLIRDLARAAELQPVYFTQIVNNVHTIQPGDARVLRIARALELPPEACFECLAEPEPQRPEPEPAHAREGPAWPKH